MAQTTFVVLSLTWLILCAGLTCSKSNTLLYSALDEKRKKEEKGRKGKASGFANSIL